MKANLAMALFAVMLPKSIDRSRMAFIRYCTDPLIAMLNQAMDGTMEMLYLNETESTQGG